MKPLQNDTRVTIWSVRGGATPLMVPNPFRCTRFPCASYGRLVIVGSVKLLKFTVLFTVVNWTNFLGIDLAKWPALKEFQARVAARPKVQEALDAEGLNKKAA